MTTLVNNKEKTIVRGTCAYDELVHLPSTKLKVINDGANTATLKRVR